MNKRLPLTPAVAGIAGVAAVVGSAGAAGPKKPSSTAASAPGLVRVRAVLDSAHVVPHLVGASADAAGLFSGALDGSILRYTFTFDKLSGPAVAAQIHFGGSKATGPIAQPLCVPCFTPEAGAVPLYDQQLVALKAGRLYVTVQTSDDARGEIRGQLSIVK